MTSNTTGSRPDRSVPFGALCLMTGVAMFTVQDLIFKLLSGLYPVHQLLTIRSVVAIPLILLFVYIDLSSAVLTRRDAAFLLLRGSIMFSAYGSYYIGLSTLPMATCMALFFVMPIFVTILSRIVLGEKVTGRSWLAVIIGFCGIAILLRPTGDILGVAAFFPIYAGFAYATTVIIVRHVHLRAGAAVMVMYSNGVYLVAGLTVAAVVGMGGVEVGAHESIDFLVRPWSMPAARDLTLVAVCGIIAAFGALLITQAYRMAPANIIAPFEYSALIWSIALGWAAWGDWPSALDWIGIAVIAACGMHVVTATARKKQDQSRLT